MARKKQRYPIASPCYDYGDPLKIDREKLLKVGDAKKILGWCRSTTLNYIRRGVVREGKRHLFPVIRLPQIYWSMEAAEAFLCVINGRTVR